MKSTKSGRRSRAARTPSPDRVQRFAGVAQHLLGAFTAARSAVTTLVGRVPGTLGATKAGAREAAGALQTLPDPTLRWLAAGSVGLSAGLFITGKPRLIIAAGIAPALALGAAIVARPVERIVPDLLVERPIEPAIPMVLVPVTTVGPKGGRPRRAALDPTRPGNGVRRA